LLPYKGKRNLSKPFTTSSSRFHNRADLTTPDHPFFLPSTTTGSDLAFFIYSGLRFKHNAAQWFADSGHAVRCAISRTAASMLLHQRRRSPSFKIPPGVPPVRGPWSMANFLGRQAHGNFGHRRVFDAKASLRPACIRCSTRRSFWPRLRRDGESPQSSGRSAAFRERDGKGVAHSPGSRGLAVWARFLEHSSSFPLTSSPRRWPRRA